MQIEYKITQSNLKVRKMDSPGHQENPHVRGGASKERQT